MESDNKLEHTSSDNNAEDPQKVRRYNLVFDHLSIKISLHLYSTTVTR